MLRPVKKTFTFLRSAGWVPAMRNRSKKAHRRVFVVSFRVTAELKRAIDDAAGRKMRTASAWLSDAARAMLKAEGWTEPAVQAGTQAAAVSAQPRVSGPSDAECAALLAELGLSNMQASVAVGRGILHVYIHKLRKCPSLATWAGWPVRYHIGGGPSRAHGAATP